MRELELRRWWPLSKKGVVEGLVPRFELDTPRVNSEAPIGLIKKTSTVVPDRCNNVVVILR